ncbi:MAG: PilN domain-containing protein [Gemmatimonadaceae bacterium]|nr:PilN domain-containing protein [Gemmatimonadaceae bacterium]
MELTADRAIAIVRERGGRMGVTAEVPFDPASPDDAVAQLRAACGGVSAVHLTVGLAHLEIAPVSLPSVPRPTARAIVATNADRYFLAQDTPAVAVDAHGTVGFATAADALARWVRAFERWAPVRVIEVAPESTVRALTSVGTRNAHLRMQAGPAEDGVLDVADGRIARVRRVPLARVGELNGAQPLAASLTRDIPTTAFSAWGAAAADPADDGAMLLSPALARRLAARRQWRGLQAALAMLLAGGALAWSLAQWRSRTAEALDARIATLTPQAAEPLAARDRLTRAASERAVLAKPVGIDALPVLAALSARLPIDAVLQRAQFDGQQWQITGTTRSTDGVVRRLAEDARFGEVRIAGPTTRFRDGGVTVESFTLAFTWRSVERTP